MRLQLELAPASGERCQLEDMPRTLFAGLSRKYASQVRLRAPVIGCF